MKLCINSALSAFFLLLTACDSDQLPVGTTVTLSPSEHIVTLVSHSPDETPACVTGEEGIYQDLPILISVTKSGGAPVGGAEVLLYSDYASNTFSGPDVIQVYADTNGNGVVDADTELVSSINSDAYKAKTDQYSGTTLVFVRLNLTCPYRGALKAYVGSSVAQALFEVSANDNFSKVNSVGTKQ